MGQEDVIPAQATQPNKNLNAFKGVKFLKSIDKKTWKTWLWIQERMQILRTLDKSTGIVDDRMYIKGEKRRWRKGSRYQFYIL